MFNDKRSKSVILIAHCILNQNSISDGTATHAGSFTEVMDLLKQHEMGILQMPCPELMCLGLDRGDVDGATRPVIEENSRIREMMTQKEHLEKLEKLSKSLVYQIEEYLKNGFEIKGIIGMDRSPSCGVNSTSNNNREISGQGVFIENLQQKLAQEGIKIDFIGIKASETQKAISTLKNLLK